MDKINVYICVNDYKISTVGSYCDGIISCSFDSFKIEYDINKKLLIKEDVSSKIILDFDKEKMSVCLKEMDSSFLNDIVVKNYVRDENKINIEYFIDEKLYKLLIMYKTCKKCLQND